MFANISQLCGLIFSFTAYPDECANVKTGHSVECMEEMWLQSGCLEEGSEYPNKLSSDQRSILSSKLLMYFVYYFVVYEINYFIFHQLQ